jgi:hypothetical protein
MVAVHLIATAFMAGVIVFVQLVHYPLMAKIDREAFVEYERGHTIRTGWVVIPPMLAEAGTALWLAALPPSDALRPAAWFGFALLMVVWVSTATLQAPAHRALMRGFDVATHRRLVTTNWIRTVAWLARLPVAMALVAPMA